MSDWSSDVCSSDLRARAAADRRPRLRGPARTGARLGGERRRCPRAAADRPRLSVAAAQCGDHGILCRAAGQERKSAGGRRFARQGGADRAVGEGNGGRAHHPPSFAQSRSEEHTSELQSLMRISYAVFCLKKTKKIQNNYTRSKVQHSPTTTT